MLSSGAIADGGVCRIRAPIDIECLQSATRFEWGPKPPDERTDHDLLRAELASLLYLKHSFDLSDEELVARWSENVAWQFFSGREYYEPRPPCDATQVVRFWRAIGEDGLEQLLKATIECAVEIKAIKPAELERVIVDSALQEKAIAHPADTRLETLSTIAVRALALFRGLTGPLAKLIDTAVWNQGMADAMKACGCNK